MCHVYSENMAIDEEDVEAFRPERFLEADGKTLKKEAVGRFTAFGMGKRQCPGEGLAKMELFLIMTTLIQKFEFHPAEKEDGSGVEEVDLEYIYGLIIYPKNQPLKIVKRG